MRLNSTESIDKNECSLVLFSARGLGTTNREQMFGTCVRRALHGSQGPNSRSEPPYANFPVEPAAGGRSPRFPKPKLPFGTHMADQSI